MPGDIQAVESVCRTFVTLCCGGKSVPVVYAPLSAVTRVFGSRFVIQPKLTPERDLKSSIPRERNCENVAKWLVHLNRNVTEHAQRSISHNAIQNV